MRAFVCDCLLTGAPCVHMHTGVVVHVLRMNMADRGCQSPQQVLLQEHPLLSSLTLEMDVALQVARFAGILLRRIRKVLRPVLGKRKLRSVYEREMQVYRTDSQSFIRNVGTSFGLYHGSFLENSGIRANRGTFGLQLPPPEGVD